MKRTANRSAVKLDTWSFGLSAVAIAAVILLNLLLGKLPTAIAQPDISDQGLYNISDTTLKLLADLDQDIDITLVGQTDTVDDRVVKFLQVYSQLSDRLHYTFVDITEDPNAPERYEVSANTIVVHSQTTDKTATVACAGFQGYTDAIVTYDPTTYTQYQQLVELSFDGDGQLTAAINTVTSEVNKTVYALTGHGETELGTSLSGMIRKTGLTVAENAVDLLMDGAIPADCDLLIINAPVTDLAADELQALLDYLSDGGHLMLVINSTDLPNFNTLTQTYGLALQEGLLGDYNRAYSMYASQYGYFCIAPTLSEVNPITSSLTANSILFYPRGMTEVAPARDTISVSPLMSTTERGFLYVDQDHDPVEGTYYIGATATEDTANGTARFTVFSSASLISEEITNYYSSLSNLDIFMNAVAANFDGEVTSLSIPAISLTVENITVPNPSLWAGLLVLVLPLGTLIFGLVHWLKRRKK